MNRARTHLSLAMIAGLLILSACAPSQPTGAGTGQDAAAPPQVIKTIKVAIGQEPSGWDIRVTRSTASPTAGGIGNMLPIAQDGVRIAGPGGVYINLLAAEVPEAAKGTWMINPNSTMDMTWKLVPNARWHDGTPVTTADFEFGVRVRNDPDAAGLPSGTGSELGLESVRILDDRTFVAHWKQVNVTVNSGSGLVPLPKHLLNEKYLSDPQGLGQMRFFTTEYVGTGPFKLVSWERGSHIEFERFDDYYKGPAKLNRVILQIIPDPNTMVANILAGAIDVVAPPNIDISIGMDVRDRWVKEGSKSQVLVQSRDGAETWEIMLNPLYARPVNGITQQPVRQALLQAVDRKSLNEVMTQGLSEVAYIFYHKDNENYPYVKDLDPLSGNKRFEYPYDARASQQLLAQAGWTKGADGILTHQPSGERFDYQVLTRRGDGPFKQASIIQDYWKAIGVNLDIHVLTTAEQDDNQYLATRTGASFHTAGGGSYIGRRSTIPNIPSPETRWTGNNRGHYASQTVTDIIHKIEVTIDEAQARELHRQNLSEQMTDLHSLMWYWVVVPVLMLEGVTGPQLVGQIIMTNIWEWDYKK
ncbi:MAG: ABC transporter substrate-binding protein [Chloroflexi bacterium]|nr:ABC transporter substrate-binding protein [Chloroflexota bacterium]